MEGFRLRRCWREVEVEVEVEVGENVSDARGGAGYLDVVVGEVSTNGSCRMCDEAGQEHQIE